MSADHDSLYVHAEDGGLYLLIDGDARWKDEATGEWVPSVIYQDADPDSPRFGQMYGTRKLRWRERFKRRLRP